MARWIEAKVQEGKILEYLLSPDHPVGGDKAAFFLAVGYTREEWTRLRDDLLQLAGDGKVMAEHETQYGNKYTVDGSITSPTGRRIDVRTVWISDRPNDLPRLVTAYPR